MSSDQGATTSEQVSAPVQRSVVDDVLASPGRPLDAEQRREFEGPLGADLSSVRVHSGDAASSSTAAAVAAEAFTSGSHVVSGGPVDRRTLAHELTHVVQQRQGPVAGTDDGDGLRVSDPGDRFEREAEATAAVLTPLTAPIQRATGDGPPADADPAGAGVIQRAPARRRPRRPLSTVAEEPAEEIELTDLASGRGSGAARPRGALGPPLEEAESSGVPAEEEGIRLPGEGAGEPTGPQQSDQGPAGRRVGFGWSRRVGQGAETRAAAGSSTAGAVLGGPGGSNGTANVSARPLPPERMTDGGRLGGGDRVLAIRGGEDAVIDRLAEALRGVLSERQLQQARGTWSDVLRASALQPVLPALTRGDFVSVPLEVGGWSGRIKVSAKVAGATTRDTQKVEFEAGGDRFTSDVGLSEIRTRKEGEPSGTFSPPIAQPAPVSASVTVAVRVLFDDFTGGSTASTGRSSARTKTKEDASRIDTGIQMLFDFSELKRPRRLLLKPRQEFPLPDVEQNIPGASEHISVEVASPAAEAAGAAGPTQHFLPPDRVKHTRALGGMDVVTDVHARIDGRASRGGVPVLVDPMAARGVTVFGEADWPTVREAILAHVSISSLQRDLKAMMVGNGIEIPLSKKLGSIRIRAEIVSMSHLRNTAETEFNVGTDTSRTVVSNDGSGWRGELTVPVGASSLGSGPVTGSLTGTPFGEYGRGNRDNERTSARSGAGLKMKVPGAVFDGEARLSFTVRKAASAAGRGVEGLGTALIGFQAIIDAAEALSQPESRGRQEYTEERRALTAPEHSPGTDIRQAGEEILGAGRRGGGGGLPSDAVILDVLAGDKGEHNPVADEVGKWGAQRFGDAWPDLQSVVLATFSRERLASSIAAMTRKVPLQSPPLVLPSTQPLPHGLAWVSATANLRELDYVRELSKKAELNVINDVSVSSSAQHNSYHGEGGSLAGSATGALPAATSLTLPSFLAGARVRHQSGTREAQAGGSIASGKFEKPMVVFIGTAEVGLHLTERGTKPIGGPTARLRFVVALPTSYTRKHTVGAPPRASQNAAPLAAPAATAAQAGVAGGLGPLRVRSSQQIAASDVVVRLDDDMAVINELHAGLNGIFGYDKWPSVQAQVLPIFDKVAIQPLVSALTHGRRWGTSVSAKSENGSDLTADINIVSARATMTEPAEYVTKFEFEVGSDSTISSGSSKQRRVRKIAQTSAAVSPLDGHLTLGPAVTRNSDDVSGGTQDDTSGVVSRAKIVEPAQLFKGKVAFTVEMKVPGFRTMNRTAEMRGEFAFPAREVPQDSATGQAGPAKSGPRYLPPARITQSHRLGSTDVVLNLLPPPPEATTGEAGAQAPLTTLSPATVVNQLAARGRRIFGSEEKWAAARRDLENNLDIDTIRKKTKSMTAGQAWSIDLGKHGSVDVTASVENLTHGGNTADAVEFNSGVSSGLALAGAVDGRPSQENRTFYREAFDAAGSSGSLLDPVSAAGNVTYTYEHGTDTGTEYASARQSGIGTKSKVPGSFFDGVVVLHFKFAPPGGRSKPAVPEIAANSMRLMEEIGEVTAMIREAGTGNVESLQTQLNNLLIKQTHDLAAHKRVALERMNDDIRALDAGLREIVTLASAGSGPAGAADVSAMWGMVERYQVELHRLLERRRELMDELDAASDGAGPTTPGRTAYARVRFTALVESKDAIAVDAEQAGGSAAAGVTGASGRGNRSRAGQKGLEPDRIIRDLPDIGSLHGLLDTFGRQAYGTAWDDHGPQVKKEFSWERLRVNLTSMTRGEPMRSHEFSYNVFRSGRVDVTADVLDLGHNRVEPQADVALVAENTSRFRDRLRRSKLHEILIAGGGGRGIASGQLALGFSRRNRQGAESQSGGRAVANAKVTQALVHFDGYLKFNFTFFSPGLVGRTSFTESGVVPFSVSLPEEATRGPEKTRGRPHLTWLGPSPQYQSFSAALGKLEAELDTRGSGSGFLVELRVSQADKRYRVVNENGQVWWYEARSIVRVPRPQDAGIFRAYELPPPG